MAALGCASLTAALTVLTPLPSLPAPTGAYAVGQRRLLFEPAGDAGRRLLATVLYPALPAAAAPANTQSYSSSVDEPRQFLRFGAPRLIWRYLSWLLDYWTLVQLPVTANAQPLPPASPRHGHPVVVFSHGNGASHRLYAALLVELASHGCIVIGIDHLDGSSSNARMPDGTWMHYDYASLKAARGKASDLCSCETPGPLFMLFFVSFFSSALCLFTEAPDDDEVWFRRRQLEVRAEEVLAAVHLGV